MEYNDDNKIYFANETEWRNYRDSLTDDYPNYKKNDTGLEPEEFPCVAIISDHWGYHDISYCHYSFFYKSDYQKFFG